MRFNNPQVGDRITVISRGGPFQFRTIARVLKNGFVDDAGQRWTLYGDEFGSANCWSRTIARPYQDSDEALNAELVAEWWEKQARKRLTYQNWDKVSFSVIEKILALLDSPKRAEE